MEQVLLLQLVLISVFLPFLFAGTPGVDSCEGTNVTSRLKFWLPDQAPYNGSFAWNMSEISHAKLPMKSSDGYLINAGRIGLNQFARLDLIAKLDEAAVPWRHGQVDVSTCLPNSTTGGFRQRYTALHENFNNGLNASRFVVLLQKGSLPGNVDIVSDGEEGNVLRLRANALTDGPNHWVASAAIMETRDFFSSGRFEVKAKFPAVTGVISALWTFHYEEHYDKAHLPPGEEDPQYVANVTGWISRLNHEIDWEIPASCSGLCGKSGGCPGQFDTANLNNYVFSNNNGIGPGYANLCARAPNSRPFVDDQYHWYAIEWHSGADGCQPHVDFFFDGKYVGTNDAFVPTRAGRFLFGMWPGNKNWAGKPDGTWKTADALISEVHICPFNEPYDSMFPQVFDQPFTSPKLWVEHPLPPVKGGEKPSRRTCKASDACEGTNDRPNGCPCSAEDQGRRCMSGCCIENKCESAKVCSLQCLLTTGRPVNCNCTASFQCSSECCVLGLCEPSSSCSDPCDRPIDRSNGCPCVNVGDCESGCCNYDARPGRHNGSCADKSVCAKECAEATHRPLGCSCDGHTQCNSTCCSDAVCATVDFCPTPSRCSVDEDRPIGCPCQHSWQCSSQWCQDLKCSKQ